MNRGGGWNAENSFVAEIGPRAAPGVCRCGNAVRHAGAQQCGPCAQESHAKRERLAKVRYQAKKPKKDDASTVADLAAKLMGFRDAWLEF